MFSFSRVALSSFIALGLLVLTVPFQASAQPPIPEAASPPSPANQDLQEPEVLDGGPLHEAFAQPLALEAQSILVDRQPPKPVNELPPEQRPAGNNVNWLPGYWFYDIEREDFIWVSGLWRNFPPGRTWVPGQWQQVEAGYQWLAGYWADAQIQEQAVLPQPPASLEQGPSSPAPSDNYLWAAGCWQWQNNNYAWQPGFWYQAQPNWVWVPNHYTYTPRGAIFVRGYWDYPLARRGILYAPVFWGPRYRAGARFVYRPRTIVNTGLLVANLFVDYNRGRYYYGRNWGVGRNVPNWLTPWGSRSYTQWGRYNGRSNLYDPLWSHFRWDGHERNGYGKYDRRDLAARNRNGNPTTKGDDLFRKVSRLTVAERESLRLKRNNADELAKFRKQAEQYRDFDRVRLTQDQARKAGNNRNITQRIPNFAAGNASARTRTRTNGRANSGSNARASGDTQARVRANGQVRSRVDGDAAVQLRQNAQIRRNFGEQQGSARLRGKVDLNLQNQSVNRRQILNSPQTTNSQRRTFDNQNLQRYLRSRANNQGGAPSATNNQLPNTGTRFNQRSAKPITPGNSAFNNSVRRRTNNTRSQQGIQLNQTQSRGRVQQAAPQLRQFRGNQGSNQLRRSNGNSGRNAVPQIRGRGNGRGRGRR